MNIKSEQTGAAPDFHVDGWIHFFGGFIDRRKSLWTKIGNFETRMISDELDDIQVIQPVYVTGLARSGSTVLLEMLALHPEVSTHQYKDYPFLFTPYLWNRYLNRTPQNKSEPVERSHRDGIFITPESPEAFEECIWMAFFPDTHNPEKSAILGAEVSNPEFETFYRDHIRKMLFVRNKERYVAKGNYNITRMEYLLEIFPDARFILPVREPVWHIASLLKQHRLFCMGQHGNPRAVAHLRRVGHFEFGIDRRPINCGDPEEIKRILSLWESENEIEGWARYWNHIHNFLANRLEKNPRLEKACRVVRYDNLCHSPGETMRDLLSHCGLPEDDTLLETAKRRISPPTYYQPDFTPRQLDIIQGITSTAAGRFGLKH